MNDHEAERIAAALNQLRPDWPIKSIRTLLAKPELANRARRDVTIALAWVACESASHTPARVLENGPWWKAAGVTGEVTKRHPTPVSACGTCGGDYGDCCDNPTPNRPTPRDPGAYTEAARQARAQLHAHDQEQQ